ncbi:hypothetical protein GQ457_HM000260 [Hibiscus cannabinus]
MNEKEELKYPTFSTPRQTLHSCETTWTLRLVVVQLSLSGVSSFFIFCLTGFVKKYGLKKFLFFDKLCDEDCLKNITTCGIIEHNQHKLVWRYASGESHIPLLGIVWLSDRVASDDGETLRTLAIRGWQALPHMCTDGESDGDNTNNKLIPAYVKRDNL